jgi:hypothetical protein
VALSHLPQAPARFGALFKFLRPDSAFAILASPGYSPSMSTAVLELKEKVEQLTSEERYELMQILEDIEDNALADKAEAEGGWTKLADLKKELGRA